MNFEMSDQNDFYQNDFYQNDLDQNDFYLLVAGSRTFTDYSLLQANCDAIISKQSGKTIHIVSGGARGADALAEMYSRERDLILHLFPADWNKYGRSAGFRRNEQMHEFIARFPFRACICFWDGAITGTLSNFDLCGRFGTPLYLVRF